MSFFSTQQFHGSNRNYSVRTDDGEAICSYIDDFQKHPEQALVRHSIYCRDVSRLSRPLVLLCINWTCLHVFSCTVRHARATSLTRFTAITVKQVCVCVSMQSCRGCNYPLIKVCKSCSCGWGLELNTRIVNLVTSLSIST